MPSKQQAIAAMDAGAVNSASPLLQRIRNMWEFANLCQWIYIFGKAANIDEALEIEDIETECLKPSSTVLSEIALALLKLVSSHRGLTHEILDEQLRKEYISKLPDKNPLGGGGTTQRGFCDLDTPLKITVLQQLTQWIMSQPERLREKMGESHDTDQTGWRIEPYGWDAGDRTYYVLDDNRVYRLSETPEPPIRKPKKQKTYGTSRRSGRRRRISNASVTEDCAPAESVDPDSPGVTSNLGGMSWECVAVTLDDVQRLINNFRTTRDPNEKMLRNQLDVHLLPILEKQEESRKRKEAQHQRELLSLAKMANAKRSSRIAGRVEQQKEEEKAKEQWAKAQKEAESQQREKQRQMELERERDFRVFSRERRLKERAARRRLHEEELSQLSEGHSSASHGRTRISDRQLQSEIDRNRRALKALEEEEEHWTFDCVCGLYGQVDDGAHSVACERCNVWQHSSCVGIEESEADRADFHFLCGSCRRQTEHAATSRKTVIKLKVKSSSELMGYSSDRRTSKVASQPIIHSMGPVTSINRSEVPKGLPSSQPAMKQSSTELEVGSGAGTRSLSNSNDSVGNNYKAAGHTTPVAAASGESKEWARDIKPTLILDHGSDSAAHLASKHASPFPTKAIPQISPSTGSVSNTSNTGSPVNSTTLPAHTTHATASQQAHVKGV